MSAEENKLLVRRLVAEAVGERNLDALDQIAAGGFAEIARRWVSPFQRSTSSMSVTDGSCPRSALKTIFPGCGSFASLPR